MRKKNGESSENFFLSLIRGSIILGALDRLSAAIYRMLKTGLFGYIFTGYQSHPRSAFAEWVSKSRPAGFTEKIRKQFCRSIEESLFVKLIQRFTSLLLGCRMKVYGTFLVSFGAYSAITAVLIMLFSETISAEDLLKHDSIMAAIILIFSAIPFLLSNKNLSEALCHSNAGTLIQKLTGFTEEDMSANQKGGHVSTAFFLGLFLGVASYAVSPFILLGGMAALVGAYLILIRPEIGVLSLFFFMPILPTMILLGIEAYTFLCYIIKLIRKKRVFRFESIDIVVSAFAFIMLTGGLISVTSASLKPALLYVGFLMAYFLVVGLIRSPEWINRCTVVTIVSATLISVYGLITYFTGTAVMDKAWLDSNLFGSIRGRAYATLENPNMYGEYLVLVIPLAVGMLIRRWSGLRNSVTLLCLGILGTGLICSWSRGALLALLIAMVVFFFIWHRRAMFLVFAGAASIPFLPFILPEAFVDRYFSIGNMADSSTSYRVGGWQASFEMLKNNFLGGIGTGVEAWKSIYPRYAYMTMESTPHAHNLYIQIAMEVGIVGLFVFLVFLFLLYQSGFTFFSRLSDETLLLPESLCPSDSPETSDVNRNLRRSRMDLRVMAAAPMCGVLAVLVQGMTDYSWYNYRVYLMMWLVCGLTSASVRTGSAIVDRFSAIENDETAEKCSCNIEHVKKSKKQKKKRKTHSTKV